MGGEAEEFQRVRFTYGVVMLKTKRGIGLLDKVGSFRISKPLAWFMLYLMPVAGAIALWLILNLVAIYLSPAGPAVVAFIRTISPLGNLLLPGINPYIPWFYGWIALVTAVFIHEASHGIVARSLGMPVKAAGVLFFLIIPIGAFVEIDDKLLRASRGRDTARVLAAGSGINIIVGVAALGLLILATATMSPAVQGAAIVGVRANTPQLYSAADVAGIRPGDFITAINGHAVTDLSPYFEGEGALSPGDAINITLWRSGQVIQKESIVLGQVTLIDTRTNATFTRAFLGVNQIPYPALGQIVTTYTTQYTRVPLAYLVLPALPLPAQTVNTNVPWSDPMVGFYTSSLGVALPFVTNLLFWVWFINFNLAIFNCLPIYPMDGGQAFETAIRSVSRGRLSDEVAQRITLSLTLVLVTLLFAAIAGPYLIGYLPT